MHPTSKVFTLVVILAGALSFSGCNKKAAQATPPPPPPPVAPTATLAANPANIEQGQTTVLTWQTDNATEATIDGLGTLPGSGSRTVMPSASTTYTLVATGAGGRREASARVTVNGKVTAAIPSPAEEDLFAKNVKDVWFDYDRSDIRSDQAPIAQSDAAFLLQHPSLEVVVEGHCDDRGSEEYNLALGTDRAKSLKRALLQQGVLEDRIKTISFGKEKPFCTLDNDQWLAAESRGSLFNGALSAVKAARNVGPPFFLLRPLNCHSTLNFRIINRCSQSKRTRRA